MITLTLHLRWPARDVVKVCDVSLTGKASAEGSLDVRGMFDNCHRVPDVDRYRVARCSGTHRLICHESPEIGGEGCNKYNDKRPQSGHSNIVVLLESPHKEEYRTRGTFSPIAPAQGRTGRNICKHLPGYFDNPPSNRVGSEYIRDNSDRSHIILCNPVQFQAFLHATGLKLTPSSKVKIWKKLWSVPGVKECFLQRLLCYRPHIIINACTKSGRNDGGCKEMVRTFLEEKRSCFSGACHVYEIAHPSSMSFIKREGFCYRTCLNQ